MNMKERMFELIYQSIDELNEQYEQEQKLEKSLDTILMGKGSKLDSLGLVNLVVSVETAIEDEFDITITLADDRAMSQKHSPFRTVGSLSEYIEMLLKEKLND